MSSILSVSQINTYLKSVIDNDRNLKNIFVSGEISNYTNHYRTGHLYFTLKDEIGMVKAVMFRNAASRLRFEPENGMKVLVRCSVSVYERDGTYQLYCEDMQLDGIGALTVAFEQLKNKLTKEGLFDSENKKQLPKYPSRIGIVTSPTGAALQDIINVISRRYPSAELILAPVQVQGDSAAGQIAAAIEEFDRKKAADVLIVGRGGGSIEDLWAFNEEVVARAIFNCSIPVISAVGHETDFTIADYVADMRAPTPSAAAEIAVPDYREILYAADKTLDTIEDCVRRIIDSYTIKTLEFEKRITDHGPQKTLQFYSQCVDACDTKIKNTMSKKLDFYQNALSHYAASLEATSPLKVLSRGYAIIENDINLPVRSVQNLSINGKIKIVLHDGEVFCAVEEISQNDQI